MFAHFEKSFCKNSINWPFQHSVGGFFMRHEEPNTDNLAKATSSDVNTPPKNRVYDTGCLPPTVGEVDVEMKVYKGSVKISTDANGNETISGEEVPKSTVQ